jgi:4-hydroxy-tetrahydrodipicolinate synthase
MMQKEFKGIITALITPFDANGNLDESGLRILLRRQVDCGVHGVAVVAGSGEFVNLSDAERRRVVEISAEEVSGRIPVIMGILSPDTASAVAWGKEAKGLGADALLLLSPYYNKPSVPGLINHFRSVAEATDLPIIAYNNPGRTGINLTSNLPELAEIPGIVGVKECNRELALLSQTIATLGDKLDVLSGEDDLLYPSFELGVKGGILTTSNVAPSHWVRMYNAMVKGDHATARAIHYEMLPFINAVYVLNHPASVKKALSIMGLPAGSTRAPLASPTPEQERRINDLILSMGLTA